jgi:hypothetical protein
LELYGMILRTFLNYSFFNDPHPFLLLPRGRNRTGQRFFKSDPDLNYYKHETAGPCAIPASGGFRVGLLMLNRRQIQFSLL